MDRAACSTHRCRDMCLLLLPGLLPRHHEHPLAQPSRSGRAAAQLRGASQSSAAAPGLELACYTLIVDDIVLPSGETIMESLGGGGARSQVPVAVVQDAARTCHTNPPSAVHSFVYLEHTMNCCSSLLQLSVRLHWLLRSCLDESAC